ncbi:MAG: hypothetical protein AAF456_12030 [Planctomycetota bacterium]
MRAGKKPNSLRISAAASYLAAALVGLILSSPSYAAPQAGQQQQYNAAGQQQQYNSAGQTGVTSRPMTEQERAAMQQAITQQPGLNYEPQLPPGFPISPEEQQYIEELLDYWQASSRQINRSKWEFERWDYDPEWCAQRDPETGHLMAFNYAKGEIRFASPDQGRFDTTESWEFFVNENQQPDYRQRDGDTSRERWICDGQAIYQFDYVNQRIYQTDIPQELQGQGLINSPLPFFLFGANRVQILERYWIRVITPQGVEDEYWLEAWPKRIEDARNYKKLEVVISRNDFLPASLHIFAQNYDEQRNPVSRVFKFDNRVVNDFGSGVQDFLGHFVRPRVPLGWRLVNSAQMAAEQQRADSAQLPQGGQTQDRR